MRSSTFFAFFTWIHFELVDLSRSEVAAEAGGLPENKLEQMNDAGQSIVMTHRTKGLLNMGNMDNLRLDAVELNQTEIE